MCLRFRSETKEPRGAAKEVVMVAGDSPWNESTWSFRGQAAFSLNLGGLDLQKQTHLCGTSQCACAVTLPTDPGHSLKCSHEQQLSASSLVEAPYSQPSESGPGGRTLAV